MVLWYKIRFCRVQAFHNLISLEREGEKKLNQRGREETRLNYNIKTKSIREIKIIVISILSKRESLAKNHCYLILERGNSAKHNCYIIHKRCINGTSSLIPLEISSCINFSTFSLTLKERERVDFRVQETV